MQYDCKKLKIYHNHVVQWLERTHYTINIGDAKVEELRYIFLLYGIFTK